MIKITEPLVVVEAKADKKNVRNGEANKIAFESIGAMRTAKKK